MTFNIDQRASIEKIADKNPIIKELWEDWQRINTDSSLQFAITLNTIAEQLNERVRDKTLTKKDEYIEAAIELINKSKPILDGLKAANILISGTDQSADKKFDKKRGEQVVT